MSAPVNDSLLLTVKRVPSVTSAFVTMVAGIVIIGWIADIGTLKSISPQWTPMKFNAAVCFLLAGISFWLLRTASASPRTKLMGRFFASAVVLTALLTLAQEALRMDFGIDQFFFKEVVNAVQPTTPGRMAPSSALNFAMIGLALLSLDWKTRGGRRPASILALLVGLLGLLAFAGYLYGAEPFYSIASFSAMAVHTALCFVALSVGVLCARHGSNPLNMLTNEGVGGRLLRQTLPFAITVPLATGWLRLQGGRAGLYGFEFGVALFAVSNVITFSITFGWRSLG